jgi:hypothetical protein
MVYGERFSENTKQWNINYLYDLKLTWRLHDPKNKIRLDKIRPHDPMRRSPVGYYRLPCIVLLHCYWLAQDIKDTLSVQTETKGV